jgi:hypothetical protein
MTFVFLWQGRTAEVRGHLLMYGGREAGGVPGITRLDYGTVPAAAVLQTSAVCV